MGVVPPLGMVEFLKSEPVPVWLVRPAVLLWFLCSVAKATAIWQSGDMTEIEGDLSNCLYIKLLYIVFLKMKTWLLDKHLTCEHLSSTGLHLLRSAGPLKSLERRPCEKRQLHRNRKIRRSLKEL